MKPTKALLRTGVVLALAAFVMGSTYPPTPGFEAATYNGLDPVPEKFWQEVNKPVEPIVIRKTVKVPAYGTPAPQETTPLPQSSTTSGGLTGSVGYAAAGGNCVNEPGVNNPGSGNPSSWPVLSGAPHIGATVLFTWNHVGVVTGIWSNGDIEVRHQNCSGCPSRYSPGLVRGYR